MATPEEIRAARSEYSAGVRLATETFVRAMRPLIAADLAHQAGPRGLTERRAITEVRENLARITREVAETMDRDLQAAVQQRRRSPDTEIPE